MKDKSNNDDRHIIEKVNGLASGFSSVLVKASVVSAYPDKLISAETLKAFTRRMMQEALLEGWIMACEIFVAEDEVIPYNKD